MRQALLKLCKRLRFRLLHTYTWFLSSGLKSCGKNVRFEFPLRLENPGSVTVGDGVIIYPRTWINAVSEWSGKKYTSQIKFGDRVMIGYGVQISAAELISIGDDVTVSAGVVIVDHIHDHRYPGTSIFDAPLSTPAPVRIGNRSFLGVYAFIGPGVQIGEQAVVAANAVVMKDVPDYCMAIGNPARITRFHNPDAETQPAADSAGAKLG